MDGLVSTGKKFPYTILKINFAIRKNYFIFFINILKSVVGNARNFIPCGSGSRNFLIDFQNVFDAAATNLSLVF